MSNDDDDLPFGLYERLVTARLKARLLRFDSATTRIVTEELDATEAHATLARHIANQVAGVLRALPQEDRGTAQTELTNQIVRLLAANPIEASRNDDLVENPPEQLLAIQPIGNLPNDDRELVAPLVALSAVALMCVIVIAAALWASMSFTCDGSPRSASRTTKRARLCRPSS